MSPARWDPVSKHGIRRMPVLLHREVSEPAQWVHRELMVQGQFVIDDDQRGSTRRKHSSIEFTFLTVVLARFLTQYGIPAVVCKLLLTRTDR